MLDLILKTILTLIGGAYLWGLICAYKGYLKNYEEIQRRYWGRNKGLIEEQLAGVTMGFIIYCMILVLVWKI